MELYTSESPNNQLTIFWLQPSWMRSREYWDDSFEARYTKLRKDPSRPPLKVKKINDELKIKLVVLYILFQYEYNLSCNYNGDKL